MPPEPTIPPVSAPPVSPADALITAFEAKVSTLDAKARKDFFYVNRDSESVKTLNALSWKADCLKGAERKAFFMAHPELEVRYSAQNFK